MMATLTQTLGALLERTTIEDHDEILKACNIALRQSKTDLEAQHIKIVALIKTDRYDDALRVLQEGGNQLKKVAQLEHVYVLYKLGQLEEACKLAKEINHNRGARHVEAQSYYRSEGFEEASRLYTELTGSEAAIENEKNDLRINGGAVDAQLEWNQLGHLVQEKKFRRGDLEAFETAYNAACGCIARGELSQGEVLLKRAKDLCILLDDLPEGDKEAELLPIGVQQVYVLSRLGKVEQAETLASEISIDEIPDLSTRQVAQVNKLVAISSSSNPYLAHRLFHSLVPLPVTHKFFQFQADWKNQCQMVLDLQSSKYTSVTNATAKALANNPSPTASANLNTISVINAAAHAQNQLGKWGLKAMLPLLDQRPNDVGLIATIVQLYILTNNQGSAITVMEAFLKRLEASKIAKDQDIRFAPGLVAVLVSLYSIQGRKLCIISELAKAASYWRHKSKPCPTLLRTAGISLLASQTSEDLATAGEIFDSLYVQDPRDSIAISGYVAAYATTDADKTTSKVEKLTPVARLVADLDTDSLEQAGVPQIISTSIGLKRKGLGDEQTISAKKRVRISRRPKAYNPMKPADPERWLPLKDRSSYRPKGKKGKQKAVASTQGGVSEQGSEALHMVTGGAPKAMNGVISGPSKPKKKKPKK